MPSVAQFLSLLAPLTTRAEVEEAEAVKLTVDALVAKATENIPADWYCAKGKYCHGGGTCCPVPDNKSFKCAPGPYATCSWDGESSCPHDSPVICGNRCCFHTQECVSGRCRRRMNGFEKIDDFVSLNGSENLGWTPARNSALDGEFERGVHEMILPHFAFAWRQSQPADRVQQCWVLGYPKSLSGCTRPWDNACRGVATSLEQIGRVKIENEHTPLKPVQHQRSEWCNDDPSKTEEYTFTYRKGFSSSSSVQFSSTVSMEAGVSVEVGADFLVESEKTTISLKMGLSTSTTKSQTFTKTESKESTQKVFVGPRSIVNNVCWINSGTVSSPFTMKVAISGNVVWACTSHKSYYQYIWDSNYWSASALRHKNVFHLSDNQFDEIWMRNIHGVYEGVHGFDVECHTHTIPLKPGQTCEKRNNVTADTTSTRADATEKRKEIVV